MHAAELDHRHDQMPSVEEARLAAAVRSRQQQALQRQRGAVTAYASTGPPWWRNYLILVVLGATAVTLYFVVFREPDSNNSSTASNLDDRPNADVNLGDFYQGNEASSDAGILFHKLKDLSLHDGTELTAASGSYQYKAVRYLQEELSLYSRYSETRLGQVFALLCLYFATNPGYEWDATTRDYTNVAWVNPETSMWLKNDNECRWDGVTCDGKQRVTQLDLSGFGLEGFVPEELTLLQHLSTVRIDDNPGLAGQVPVFWGALPLTELTMTGLSYTGEVPGTICQLVADNSQFVFQADCSLECDPACCTFC